MKRDQAFILYLKGLCNDLVNNHVMLLKAKGQDIRGRGYTYPTIEVPSWDEVEASLDEFMLRQAEELQKKLDRIHKECFEYLSMTDEEYNALHKEDLESGWSKSAKSWRKGDSDDE